MGFGGGGSGSFVLPNHDHTNVLADGGALDEAVSLINDGGADVTFAVWIAAILASKAPTNQRRVQTAGFSTASATMVDITGFSITMPTVTNGKYFLSACINWGESLTSSSPAFRLKDNTTAKSIVQGYSDAVAGADRITTLPLTGDQAGQVVIAQCLTNTGTLSIHGTGNRVSIMESLEVQ